jgi:hypothetical protein
MSRSPFASNPVIVRLPNLIKEIASGGIQIPRFQRPFEWSDAQRLTLLDSIRQGLPIGSLLTWKTSSHKLASYERLGPFVMSPPSDDSQRTYLLDGHQRVSTLYGALSTGALASTPLDDEVRWPIFFDLEEQEFLLAKRNQKTFPPTWLKLSALLDGEALWDALAPLRERGQSDLARRARALAETFTDYQIPVVPILSEDLPLVIKSFQRVNSQGTKMSELSMVRALTWSPDFDLSLRLQQIIEEQLTPVGWGELEPDELLDAIKVFFDVRVYASEADDLSNIVKDNHQVQRFTDCLLQALTFLREQCGIFGPKLLPYRYQLACLIAAAAKTSIQKNNPRIAERLTRWFWATTYQEYFGGAMNRQIKDAANQVRALVSTQRSESIGIKLTALRPIQRFHLNSARCRALVLMLLRHKPAQGAARATVTQTQLSERVSTEGALSIAKIIPSSELADSERDSLLSESPGNRWVALPEHIPDMLAALRESDPVHSAFLRSHLISESAAIAYQEGRLADFIRQRADELFQQEQAFAVDVGAALPPTKSTGVRRSAVDGQADV